MAKRGRNLAALAALGALGYGYMARGDKQDGKDVPVSDAVPVGTRARDEDERDGTTPAAASAAVAAPSKESYYASEGRRNTPVASLEGNRGASLLGGRIVSKEELAKSGLSLRDFLNKERGLTRRGPSTRPEPELEPVDVDSLKPNVIYNAQRKEVRPLKKGGAIKMASGGSTSGASRRADGIAQRGKTKGRMV